MPSTSSTFVDLYSHSTRLFYNQHERRKYLSHSLTFVFSQLFFALVVVDANFVAPINEFMLKESFGELWWSEIHVQSVIFVFIWFHNVIIKTDDRAQKELRMKGVFSCFISVLFLFFCPRFAIYCCTSKKKEKSNKSKWKTKNIRNSSTYFQSWELWIICCLKVFNNF